jgi:hypothetical protein
VLVEEEEEEEEEKKKKKMRKKKKKKKKKKEKKLFRDLTDEFILFVSTASHLFAISVKYLRSDCFIVYDAA